MSKMVARVIQSNPVRKSDASEQLYPNAGRNVGEDVGGGLFLGVEYDSVEAAVLQSDCNLIKNLSHR